MSYDPDWKGKKWIVVKADSSSGLRVGDTLALDGSGSKNGNLSWEGDRGGTMSTGKYGSKCDYQAGTDEVKVEHPADPPTPPPPITYAMVRRKMCLIGPATSGGATWVAEEGG